MKKLLLISLFFPMIGFGQINEQSPIDALINVVLEGTSNYFEHRNDVVHNNEFKISTKKKCIDWNSSQLIKWKIIVPKDSLEVIYNLVDFKTMIKNKLRWKIPYCNKEINQWVFYSQWNIGILERLIKKEGRLLNVFTYVAY